MSLNIGDNFSYLGKKFLDARQSFDTLEFMNACNDVPESFITYCKETDKRYEYKNGVWIEYITTNSILSFNEYGELVVTINGVTKIFTPRSDIHYDYTYEKLIMNENLFTYDLTNECLDINENRITYDETMEQLAIT